VCENCGLDTWLGDKIPLQLHHKDGNHSNNKLENLQLLCPNCHSLTDTYAGRNKHKKIKPENGDMNDGNHKILCPICKENYMSKTAKMCLSCHRNKIASGIPSREILKDEIRNNSFTSIGRKYGVDGNSVKKWCKKYGLPHLKSEIKRMTASEWDQL